MKVEAMKPDLFEAGNTDGEAKELDRLKDCRDYVRANLPLSAGYYKQNH